ncbi:MAG TPA: magnesium/cobalt transporter CorA [Acidimicrobiia bacterium]|nr:magnesium/cobalt transporter CorA [Acidimicrobiia bacterium]
MISVWRYEAGVAGRTAVELDELVKALDPEHAVVWIDCTSPSHDDLTWLKDELGIGPVVIDALTNREQPTKLMRYGDYFHVAAHDCKYGPNGLERREIDIVVGPGWVVTVRHPAADGGSVDVDEIAHRFELQRTEHSQTEEGFLLWSLFDVVIDRYFDVNDAIDERLEDVEEIVFDEKRAGTIPRDVFALRRDLMLFRRAAAPVRDVVNAIIRREISFVSEAAIVHFQDLYDRLLRVVDLIESQRDLLTGLLEADLAVISNRLNEVMKKMTSWGAILIVATLIASIYGMNFPNIPTLHWRFGYVFALALMVGITIGFYVWFKKREWL